MTCSRHWLWVWVACAFVFCFASGPAVCQETTRENDHIRNPLDDTGGFIHFVPSLTHVLACDTFQIALTGTFTDARVWSLDLLFDNPPLVLLSVIPGPHTSLHVMPHLLDGDTLFIDGFFHPNFSGNTTLATLVMTTILPPADDTGRVGFMTGEGFSGTSDDPEPIQISGDTSYVFIEATPPEIPSQVIIDVLPYATHDDSILVMWRRVFYDVDGDTLINPLYRVFLTDVLNSDLDTVLVGVTPDTFYYSTYVQNTFQPGDTGVVNVGVFQVRARKTQP